MPTFEIRGGGIFCLLLQVRLGYSGHCVAPQGKKTSGKGSRVHSARAFKGLRYRGKNYPPKAYCGETTIVLYRTINILLKYLFYEFHPFSLV